MTTNDETPPGTPPLKIDHPDNRENAFQGQRFAQIVPRNAPPTRGISPPELPPDFRLRLIEQYRQRQQSTRALSPDAPGISTREAPLPPPANNWIPIGPSVVRHGQAATRPAVSGRINGIAVAQNAAVVYAASANGGVWRSDDQGHSWRSTMEAWDLNPTTFASDSLSCGAIAVAPSDPYRVYVGTGEPYGAGDSYNGVGPIRSEDGGQNWITEQTEPGSPPLAGSGFYRLAVDPVMPSVWWRQPGRASTGANRTEQAAITGRSSSQAHLPQLLPSRRAG